jgi:hypothetical protein
MRNVRVLPYKTGSRSANALAESLGCLRVNLRQSNLVNTQPKTIINWGNSGRNMPPLGLGDQHTYINRPEAVAAATNKLTAFRVMQEAGVRVPDFTTDYEEALDWLEHGGVVVRNTLTGHSGEGIDLISPEEADDMVTDAPLYVKYVPKQDEYRIHVMDGQVIDMQRKARSIDVPDEDVNWQIRNHANGFIFMRDGIDTPADVIAQAKQAVSALRLDFGAVDVIWNQRREKAYVLEVNTACGLEGTTLARYTVAFGQFIEEGSVSPTEGIVDTTASPLSESLRRGEEIRRAFLATSPTASRINAARERIAAQYVASEATSNRMRDWQVGDEVQISPDSPYYGSSSTNPRDTRGVVTQIRRDLRLDIRVQWDTGRLNRYTQRDLIPWQEQRVIQDMDDYRVGDLVRFTSNFYSFGAGSVGRIYRKTSYDAYVEHIEGMTVVNPDDRMIRSQVLSPHSFNKIELVENIDVQSSTGMDEAVSNKWVVVVDGRVDSEATEYESLEEAEMALTSPDFHNLRAMGRHVAVQQL